YEEPKVVQKPTTESSFLPSRGYWKKGDKDNRVGYMCDYFYTTFPAYAKSLKRNKENLKGNLFGDNLEAWVKMFQKNTGLVADGMVGPKTYAMMKKYGFKH
ncbi:MAG: peptidoglycan-binding protein, partial [Clostridiales bacterium]|nr:peptidoglycan-binding protein [Candidatus Apopatousia equi]